MLDSLSSTVLQTQPQPVRQIRGPSLAFSKKPARIRAKLAADIVAGRVEVVALTVGQAARLCRVRRASVSDARKSASLTLMKIWLGASPEERIAFVDAIGPEDLWDVLTQTL
jgi:hypothetical protein